MSSHNTLRFKVEYRDYRGLYSAQTLDQASFWRSKMCFQKFIIYILMYTHRKAPFIRTWVLAIQYVRKKKWDVQSNLTEVCEFGAQISAFFGACRLQRARYANCLAEIQRESSFCETRGEWIFALKNVKQSLKSFLYLKFMRKTVESRQNMQQQKWKTKGDVKLKLYSISELYLCLSMFWINGNFFKIMDRLCQSLSPLKMSQDPF